MNFIRIPLAVCLYGLVALGITAAATEAMPVMARLRIEAVHPWRPPFGPDRVGQSQAVVIETTPALPSGALILIARSDDQEIARQTVVFSEKSPRTAHVWFADLFNFDEVILQLQSSGDTPPLELARQKITLPAFEADAAAHPETIINPVDLNTVLVPSDWLLLGPGQTGRLTIHAIQRSQTDEKFQVKTWFESAADRPSSFAVSLPRGVRGEKTFALVSPATAEHDVLHVAIFAADGAKLWAKKITTMRIAQPIALPRFGAVETKLRYDAPISVRNAAGNFSDLAYADAWAPKFKDVVVALPNGSRFVFWRGSSYIPFWASRSNVGLCCEWAEIIPPFPPDVTDCVEPLMDKELRYGRVEVMASTAARVHVRWTYQSNDLVYKVWGDQAVEDYYFYPDGFGTRVLTLKRDPLRVYELSEFILIAPQATYPFAFVPTQPADILFLDGETRHINFPAKQASLGQPRDLPAVYRVRPHRDDPASVVYFNPRERALPRVFGAFYDQGQLVTPAYWGSHWPLARGNATGYKIDARVQASPNHTSLMTWQAAKPEPISTRTGPSVDALGRAKIMTTEQWVWLIGMTAAPDSAVMARAKSFASPPSIEAIGAHVHPDGYLSERRALRLVADSAEKIQLKLIPQSSCVNPVIELDSAPGKLLSITQDDQPLAPENYAWDGQVLWLNVIFTQPTTLTLHFKRE